MGTIRNITKQKKAEDALQLEKDRAQQYLDIAGVMLVALGPDGVVTLINKKGCQILGYDEEEIIGKNWFDNFIPADIRKEIRDVFDELMRGASSVRQYNENPVLTKKGTKLSATSFILVSCSSLVPTCKGVIAIKIAGILLISMGGREE